MTKIAKSHPTTLLALTLVAAVSQPAFGATLDKIKSAKVITFGYREASVPFSYLGNDQKPIGFSIDLCRWVADSIKRKLSLDKIDIRYVPVNASNRIPLVQNDTVDIECGSTTNTADRQKQVGFSVATFVSQPSWLTTVGSGIATAAGLKGRTVVITQGSLNLQIGHKIDEDEKLGLKIIQGKDHAESLLMLETGRAVGYFEDNILLAGIRASSRNPKEFRFLPDKYEGLYYHGLMLRRDDPTFKAAVDEALTEKMASGEFAKAYDAWFTRPIPPRDQNLELPMSEALRDRVAHPSDSIAP